MKAASTVAELLALPIDDALRAVARVVASDPELRMAFSLGVSPAAQSGPVLLMKPAAYAERVGVCGKTLRRVLPRDAWRGTGRMRRVVVATADEAMLADDRASTQPEDDVSTLARRHARLRSVKGGAP